MSWNKQNKANKYNCLQVHFISPRLWNNCSEAVVPQNKVTSLIHWKRDSLFRDCGHYVIWDNQAQTRASFMRVFFHTCACRWLYVISFGCLNAILFTSMRSWSSLSLMSLPKQREGKEREKARVPLQARWSRARGTSLSRYTDDNSFKAKCKLLWQRG